MVQAAQQAARVLRDLDVVADFGDLLYQIRNASLGRNILPGSTAALVS